MKVVLIHNLHGRVSYDDIDSVVPPTSKFPYWTLYPSEKKQCLFYIMYSIDRVEMEEVEDGSIQFD